MRTVGFCNSRPHGWQVPSRVAWGYDSSHTACAASCGHTHYTRPGAKPQEDQERRGHDSDGPANHRRVIQLDPRWGASCESRNWSDRALPWLRRHSWDGRRFRIVKWRTCDCIMANVGVVYNCIIPIYAKRYIALAYIYTTLIEWWDDRQSWSTSRKHTNDHAWP